MVAERPRCKGKELREIRSACPCPSCCRLEPADYTRYDLFNPFVDCPGGRPLTRLGPPGDGGKWLCMEGNNVQEPCVAYSIGSAGEYGFESAILQASRGDCCSMDCCSQLPHALPSLRWRPQNASRMHAGHPVHGAHFRLHHRPWAEHL